MPGSPELKLPLSRRSTTQTGTADFSSSVTERRERDIDGSWRGATPQQPQVEMRGTCWGHITARSQVQSFSVGFLTRSASCKTCRRAPTGETAGLG